MMARGDVAEGLCTSAFTIILFLLIFVMPTMTLIYFASANNSGRNMGAVTEPTEPAEPLTFKTRIIYILTVGAEQNVIARVHVEGVERVCQVPPDVFKIGEKVRISA